MKLLKLIIGILLISLANSLAVPVNQEESFSIKDGSQKEKRPITLNIYYETLCPDSLRFLETQILPLLQPNSQSSKSNPEFSDINSLLDIQFIPYGKAATLQKQESEGHRRHYDFLCQHGPLECAGNKMHACTLASVNKASLSNNFHLAKFFLCTMKHLITPTEDFATFASDENATHISLSAFNSCFTDLFPSDKFPEELSMKVKNEVEFCMQSPQGSELLKHYGELTSSLEPKLYFVPWVTYNGVWSKGLLEQSQTDVKKVLCSLLTPKTMPYFRTLGCLSDLKQNGRQSRGQKVSPTTLKHRQDSLSKTELVHFGGPLTNEKKIGEGEGVTNSRPSISENGRGRRRAFLHANNDMNFGNGHSSWRWRVSPDRQQWRWRSPIVIPVGQ